jgi:hypothetical protein
VAKIEDLDRVHHALSDCRHRHLEPETAAGVPGKRSDQQDTSSGFRKYRGQV